MHRKCVHRNKSSRYSQLSTLFIGAGAAIYFEKIFLLSTASSLPAMSGSGLKTFLVYILTSDGRAFWKTVESFPQPTSLGVLAAENTASQ